MAWGREELGARLGETRGKRRRGSGEGVRASCRFGGVPFLSRFLSHFGCAEVAWMGMLGVGGDLAASSSRMLQGCLLGARVGSG